MKVLVLGNGFDLYHKLPTRYLDFMHVVKRLKELGEDYTRCHYIRFMFGEESPLYKEDEFIQHCYELHSDAIKGTKIHMEELDHMVALANKNMWIAYFEKICEADIGWIDFEKEIVDVIKSFKRIFNYVRGVEEFNGEISWSYGNELRLEDIERFNKFGGFYAKDIPVDSTYIVFDEEYLTPQITGTEVRRLDEEKIIGKMYQELQEFIKILNIYIKEFVDQIAVNKVSDNEIFEQADYVVNFNYTNVYEKLYQRGRDVPVFHIHGIAKEGNIVLGVNADADDELEQLDTRFIKFKKYFQRLEAGTDLEYAQILEIYNDMTVIGERKELYFIGHSLDVTDEDIIKELIERSDSVKIYYHSKQAMNDYITNLVKLFGKSEMTQMRLEGKLKFKELPEFRLREDVEEE